MRDGTSVVQQILNTHNTPLIQVQRRVAETHIEKEVPVAAQLSVRDVAPIAEEQPVAEETSIVEEQPVAEEAPVIEDQTDIHKEEPKREKKRHVPFNGVSLPLIHILRYRRIER